MTSRHALRSVQHVAGGGLLRLIRVYHVVELDASEAEKSPPA
jgi:hypothetical protein